MKRVVFVVCVIFATFYGLAMLVQRLEREGSLRKIDVYAIENENPNRPFLSLYYGNWRKTERGMEPSSAPIVLLFPGRGSAGYFLRDIAYELTRAGFIAATVTFTEHDSDSEWEEERFKVEDLIGAIHVVRKLEIGDPTRIALVGHSDGVVPFSTVSLQGYGVAAVAVIGKTMDLRSIHSSKHAAFIGLYDELNDEKDVIHESRIAEESRIHLGGGHAFASTRIAAILSRNTPLLFISPLSDHFSETGDPLIIENVVRFFEGVFGGRLGDADFEADPRLIRSRILVRCLWLMLVFALPPWACWIASLVKFTGERPLEQVIRYGLSAVTIILMLFSVADFPSIVGGSDHRIGIEAGSGDILVCEPVPPSNSPLLALLFLILILTLNGFIKMRITPMGITKPGSWLPFSIGMRNYLIVVFGLIFLLSLAAANLVITDEYFWRHRADFLGTLPAFLALYPIMMLSQLIDRIAVFIYSGSLFGGFRLFGCLNPVLAVLLLVEALSPGGIIHIFNRTFSSITQPGEVGFLHADRKKVFALVVLIVAMVGLWTYQISEGAINREQIRLLLEAARRTTVLPFVVIVLFSVPLLVGRSKRVRCGS